MRTTSKKKDVSPGQIKAEEFFLHWEKKGSFHGRDMVNVTWPMNSNSEKRPERHKNVQNSR